MPVVKLALTAVGLAVAVSRHPATRAALKAAPHLVPQGAKQAAYEGAKSAAYNAGVVARHIVHNRLISR